MSFNRLSNHYNIYSIADQNIKQPILDHIIFAARKGSFVSCASTLIPFEMLTPGHTFLILSPAPRLMPVRMQRTYELILEFCYVHIATTLRSNRSTLYRVRYSIVFLWHDSFSFACCLLFYFPPNFIYISMSIASLSY